MALTVFQCRGKKNEEPEVKYPVFKCMRCGQKWRGEKETARKAYQKHALGDEVCDPAARPEEIRV